MTPDPPAAANLPPRVLEHYQDPYHLERLERPSHAAEKVLPLCEAPTDQTISAETDSDSVAGTRELGTDRVLIELRISPAGEILEAAFDGQGCVISQAAASMLVERVEGLSIDQAKEFSAAAMRECFGSPIEPHRQRCLLLAWRAFQSALDCPLAYDEEEDAQQFGGPSLNEET
ncbi:MAG: iron-sulfur cluster assembly scaffold protein [Planctomycetaceae bacterium]|nr:MAG: iron-sulfur cluster assembly scaffold protein [Planctomycetaceae bacterium]